MPPDATGENLSESEKKSHKIGSGALTSELKAGEDDDAFDSLAKQLMQTREQLRTERFLFFALILIALDAFLLTYAAGWGMAAFIILQILFMAILANYLDTPSAKSVFSQLYAVLKRR